MDEQQGQSQQQAMQQGIERDVRLKIGDLIMEVIVLRNALNLAQGNQGIQMAPEAPRPQANGAARPQ